MEFVQQVFELLLAAGPVEIIAILKNRQDILFHGQLAEYRCFLRQVSQSELRAAVHRLRGKILAVQ